MWEEILLRRGLLKSHSPHNSSDENQKGAITIDFCTAIAPFWLHKLWIIFFNCIVLTMSYIRTPQKLSCKWTLHGNGDLLPWSSHLHVKPLIFTKLSGTWLSCGGYGVYVAIAGSVWLLWDVRGNTPVGLSVRYRTRNSYVDPVTAT